jgi:septum site-determining protein MinC
LIDLQKLDKQQTATELTNLFALLRQYSLAPIGVRAATDIQNAYALDAGIPILPVHAQHAPLTIETVPKILPIAEKIEAHEKNRDTTHEIENKMITHPVRSGQRVYAKGDLIVTATVSAGAEIMAEGNIHIYGSLRGKALAGVLGNTDSRIFCSDLQAELISIAGIYKLSDDLDKYTRGQPVQISLQEQTLLIKAI